jgi:hypothetical protein
VRADGADDAVTSLSTKILSARDAVRFVWRCCRISRELGIPFDDVYEMQMNTLEEEMREEERARRRQAKLRS